MKITSTNFKHLFDFRWYSANVLEYHPHLLRLKSVKVIMSALTVMNEMPLGSGYYS